MASPIRISRIFCPIPEHLAFFPVGIETQLARPSTTNTCGYGAPPLSDISPDPGNFGVDSLAKTNWREWLLEEQGKGIKEAPRSAGLARSFRKIAAISTHPAYCNQWTMWTVWTVWTGWGSCDLEGENTWELKFTWRASLSPAAAQQSSKLHRTFVAVGHANSEKPLCLELLL